MRSILSGVLLVLAAVDAFAQATWVVEATPILDIPAVSKDGAVVFSYAAGGVRLRDGGLLIADRVENNIRVFDASGKLLRTLGRMGSGPGEFQSILWAGRCGQDSLLAWDHARRQATMVGASGTIARQFTIPTGDTAQVPFQFSCSARGSMVYRSQPRPVRGTAPNAQNTNITGITAAVYRTGRDGSIQQRMGDVPAGEYFLLTGPGGGRGGAPRPLGRSASVGALDDAVVISSADSAVVTLVRSDGRTSRHPLPITLRAPTKEEFDEAVQVLVSMAPGQMRESILQAMASAPVPELLPPTSALISDTEDLLWIQTTPPGGKSVDFLVMNNAGNIVARARIPRGLTVFDIGRDYILGSYTDSGDEMHVALFRLRR